MWRVVAVVLTLVASPLSAREEAAEESPAMIEVMILGTYHFANPGQDVVNMEVDDVLSPRRQREIEVLVETLAEWRPSRIAVENEAQPPTLELPDYAQTEQLLRTTRNESVQVGYRLARMLDHDKVYGFDERGGEGEPDYFPMGKVQEFAQEKGGTEILASLFAEVEAMVAEEQAGLADRSIAQSLLVHNDPARLVAMHDRLYYSMLRIGDGEEQPGAELNAYWYMRNAKMFAKIDMIARPGDRVLVIAGSGHATWLRHFVRHMPGYALVEALPYIEKAAARSEAVGD
jgi:hypothetical protein